MNITATVAMPLYNMGKIAELALEGLCNQVTDYKWELIVCEEQNDQMLGTKKLLNYKERLEKAGCVYIVYDKPKEWIPLGMKWKRMADLASDTLCFILQAGDCYPHKDRIFQTVNSFRIFKCNFYDEQQGYFYSFIHKKTILFNPKSSYKHSCRLNMAWDTKLIKRLPDNKIEKAVDNFLFITLNKIKTIKPYRYTKLPMNYGVDTYGYNNISKRNQFFNKPSNIFTKTDIDIVKYLPILKKFEL